MQRNFPLLPVHLYPCQFDYRDSSSSRYSYVYTFFERFVVIVVHFRFGWFLEVTLSSRWDHSCRFRFGKAIDVGSSDLRLRRESHSKHICIPSLYMGLGDKERLNFWESRVTWGESADEAYAYGTSS